MEFNCRRPEVLTLLFSLIFLLNTDAAPVINGGRPLEGVDYVARCTELSTHPVTIAWSRTDKEGNAIGGALVPVFESRNISGIIESTSKLTLQLTRADDESQLKCTVTSNSGSVQSAITRLFVHVTPSKPIITISGKDVTDGNAEVSEGQNVTIICTVAESKPAPYIDWRWTSGSNTIAGETTTNTNSPDGTFKTVGEATFIATQSMNGHSLICTAQSSQDSNSFVRVNVVYKPSVNVDRIYYKTRTGARLAMGCRVTSNPPATRVSWLQNGTEVVINSRITIGSNTNPSLTINNVQESDAGVYLCTATNDAGTIESNPVRVEVEYAPKVSIIGPTSFRLEEGERVTLQCQIDADPAVNFVIWKKGTTSLIPLDTTKYEGSSASSPNLVIKSVSRSDAGRYVCTANNNIDTSSSSNGIDIIVNYGPATVTIDPPSRTVTEDDSVVLRCISDGEPAPQYRFFKDGLVVGNAAFYNIPSVGASDNGTYTCNAYNDDGSANQTMDLIVNYKPIVNIPKESYGADESGSVTIPCEFQAQPEVLSVQWSKGSAPIALAASGGKYAGGSLDNPNLTINTLTSADAGNYICQVSNRIGTGEDTTTVAISFAPVNPTIINNNPQPKERDPVTLTCGASGTPEPTYTWYKDDVFVSSARIISIPAVSITDAGRYRCEASNSKGTTNATVLLDVLYSPKLKFVNDAKVVGGEASVVIPLEINANPAPSLVNWYRNGLPFTLTPPSKYSGGTAANPALLINDINPSDNGVYQAEVTNSIGTTRSPTINVTGLFPPTNTRVVPETQQVKENEPININCLADGSPAPSFYWTRGESTFKYFEGSSSFAIATATADHNTYFTCHVSNPAGNATARAYVIVLYQPQGRTDQRYTGNIGDTVTLMCGNRANPPATSYRWWFNDVALSETSGNLTVLINSTLFGNYICRARNSQGESGDIFVNLDNDTPPTVGASTGLSLTYIILIVLVIVILVVLAIIIIIFCCKQGLCVAICGKTKRTNSKSRVNPAPEPPMITSPTKKAATPLPYNGYTSSTSTVSRQDVEINVNGPANGTIVNGTAGRARPTTARPTTARPTTARIRLEEGSQYNANDRMGTGPIISIMEPELNSARAHQLPPLMSHETVEQTPIKKMKRKRKRRHRSVIREEDDAALTANQQTDRETPISD